MSATHTIGSDAIYQRFMERQRVEGLALAESSDILSLFIPPMSPPHFVAEFSCKGLIRDSAGEIKEANRFRLACGSQRITCAVQIRLRWCACLLQVYGIQMLVRISFDMHGRITPGTPLVDILFQIYDILTYHKFNPREDDSLTEPPVRGLAIIKFFSLLIVAR